MLKYPFIYVRFQHSLNNKNTTNSVHLTNIIPVIRTLNFFQPSSRFTSRKLFPVITSRRRESRLLARKNMHVMKDNAARAPAVFIFGPPGKWMRILAGPWREGVREGRIEERRSRCCKSFEITWLFKHACASDASDTLWELLFSAPWTMSFSRTERKWRENGVTFLTRARRGGGLSRRLQMRSEQKAKKKWRRKLGVCFNCFEFKIVESMYVLLVFIGHE